MGKEASGVSGALSSRIKRLSKLPPPRVLATKGPTTAAAEGSFVVSTKPPNGVLSEHDGSSASSNAVFSQVEWMERIGSRVCVGGAKMGILLFYGKTQFADGVWCGVVLDEPVGKNDGTVSGVRYFTCKQGHGIFAPPQKVFLDDTKGKRNVSESKSNDTFVRSFDSVSESGRKTWPLTKSSAAKNPSASDNANESFTMQNGSMLSTKAHAQKRMSSSSTIGTARPSKIRSKSKSPAANLDSTVVLAKNGASFKTSERVASPNATFCASVKPDFSSFAIAASLDSTFTATKPSHDGIFVNCVQKPPSCNGGCDDPNYTFTNEPKLNGTFTLDDDKTEPEVLATNTTVSYGANKSNLKTIHRDVSLPLATIQETDYRKTVVSDPSIDDLWKFDENYDYELIGSDPCALGSEAGGLVRQGSLELDESLGILTPDQMRDFTLAADTTAAQTPSDEGIQEIVDDEVADLNDIGAAFTTGEPKNLDFLSSAVETPSFTSLEILDKLSEDEILDPLDSEGQMMAGKTSTPFRKADWFNSPSLGICDEVIPVSSCNETHFSFTDSPVVSNATFGSKSGKLSTLFELDVSNISSVTVQQVSIVSAGTSLTDVTKLNETFKTRNPFNRTVELDFSGIEPKKYLLEEMTSIKNVKTELSSTAEESLAVNLAKQLSFIVKKDVVESLPEVPSDLPMSTNTDGAVEFLLQHMSRNFVEHVVDGKKEQSGVSEMAVSVTSIDTGYQGDAECDLQSDAGTNAANTPVEDNRKEFEMAALIEVGKHLKSGDPGSDSDFCSDMATSLTESEMEGEDRGGRGRGARVIDGRLYYSNASISKDTEVTNSNECVSSEVQKNGVQVENVTSVANVIENAIEEVTNEIVSTSASALDSSTDCDATIRNSTILEFIATEKQTEVQSEPEVELVPVVTIVMSNTSTEIEKDNDASRNSSKLSSDQLGMSFQDHTKGGGVSNELNVTSDRKSLSVSKGISTPKPSTSKMDSTKDKKGKVVSSADRNKKGGSSKKESPNTVAKKQKSPKKNVMSKIKAMIEATSHILTNKDQPAAAAAIAAGSGDAAAAVNVNNESVGKKKSTTRTPKKSRWDAVMSKIAAGQAEEKVKTKKEVTSRVNTNLSSGKLNVSTKSAKSEGSSKVADVKSMAATTQRPRPSSKADASSCSTGIRKPMTKGSVGGASCSDTADVSLQSHSERSNFQKTSKLPRSAKLPRPSTLNIGQPNAVSMNSRSPSQASVMSGMSQGSTLSQLTLASQASTHPPQDISLASCDRSVSRSGYGFKSVSTVPTKKVSSSPRPLLPAVPQMGTRRATLGRTSTTVRVTSDQKRSQATTTTKTSRSPGSRTEFGTATVRPKSLPKIGSEPSLQHRANHKDQSGQLRSLKTSSGLVKSGPQHDNRLLSTVTRSETAAAAREVSRLEALCEARTKELNFVRIQLKQCAVGFDSMAVLLQYLTQELNAFSVPDLANQLKKAKEELIASKADLEETKNEQRRLQDEISKIEGLHSTALEEIVAKMSEELEEHRLTLIREHKDEFDRVIAQHETEIESLSEKHIAELAATEKAHEIRTTEANAAHDQERDRLKDQHLLEREELVRCHKSEMKLLTSKHEQVESLLRDKVTELTERCESLESQTQSLKEELMNDSDYRVQASSNRCRALQNEVDSLKSVLEMRQTEMQDLRREKLELKCQAEELSLAKDRIKKLEAKNEDLRAMMDIRVQHERQLSSERQTLIENYEKESKVSKRLSMENEELQWRLQQNKEIQSSLSCIEGGSDSSFSKSEPTPPGNMSMYFWDNEGLVNSSFNGNCFTPKTSFTCFKGPHGTAWSATSPMGTSSPRISPCKSPSSNPTNGRHRKPSASEDESLIEINEISSSSAVRLREKPKRKVSSRHGYESRVSSSSKVTNDNEIDVANSNKIDIVIDSVILKDDETDGEYISEDILVANEAFTEVDEVFSNGGCSELDVRSDVMNGGTSKSEYDDGLECVESGIVASECGVEVLRLCDESRNVEYGFQLSDVVEDLDLVDEILVTKDTYVESNLTNGNDKESQLAAFVNGNSESSEVKVMIGENGEEEQPDSASVESSGSGIPADDISSGKDHFSIESYDNARESTQLSPFSSPDHQHVTKSTTTVVISFRSNRHSIGSSRASSPLPQLLGTSTASESCESRSSESSSRASPLVGEQLLNKQLHLLDGTLFDGFRSPRISAGESMVLEDFSSSSCSQPDPSHVLLKKALQDQLLHGNRDSSRGSMDLYAREASLDGSPLPGISKPDTPESTSQAVPPTDSSNMDMSWSDDDLASDTEV